MPIMSTLNEIWGNRKGKVEEFPPTVNTVEDKDKLVLQPRPSPITEVYGNPSLCSDTLIGGNDQVGTSLHHTQHIENMIKKYLLIHRYESKKNSTRVINILIIMLVILLLGLFTVIYMLSNHIGSAGGMPYPRCL